MQYGQPASLSPAVMSSSPQFEGLYTKINLFLLNIFSQTFGHWKKKSKVEAVKANKRHPFVYLCEMLCPLLWSLSCVLDHPRALLFHAPQCFIPIHASNSDLISLSLTAWLFLLSWQRL